MTAKESFLAKLDEEKKASEASEPEKRREWLAALKELFHQFHGWLAGAEKKGLLRVEEYEVDAASVGTKLKGPFKVPALKLITPRAVIDIVPKARMVVGAMGRVDFVSGAKKRSLMRAVPGRWAFSDLMPQQGGWVSVELTEESFFRTLDEMLT